MKKLKRAFYFIIILMGSCSEEPIEKNIIPLSNKESRVDSVKKKLEVIPKQQSRDTIRIEDLIEEYLIRCKSTNGLDTLVNGTYESIYESPKYQLEIVDTITQNDFLKIRNSYESYPNSSSFNKNLTQPYFSITTADYIIEFALPSVQKLGNVPYYTDLNYIKRLNAFTFNRFEGSGGNGAGTFWLIDSLTSRIDRLDGFYEHFDHISVSKDKSKIICSASNEYFETGASIKILKANWKNAKYQLSYLLDYRTKNWSVGECYMINDSRIAASAFNSFEFHYKSTKDSNYKSQSDPDNENSRPTYLILQIRKVLDSEK